MGGIEVDSGQKRELNKEINMIPFIDLLLVTIAFLLITAVWVTFSRINANAQVPGTRQGPDPPITGKILHLHAGDQDYSLVWKQGATTIAESRVPKPESGSEQAEHAALSERIAEEWKQHGQHQDPNDREPDQCVLHTDNRMPFSEIVTAIDAVYETKRAIVFPDGRQGSMPVFNVAFSAR